MSENIIIDLTFQRWNVVGMYTEYAASTVYNDYDAEQEIDNMKHMGWTVYDRKEWAT